MDFGTELSDIKTKNDLTPEEQKIVDSYVSQIDLNNTQLVIQYGAGAQKKIADFSEGALNNVRTKDMGEIGDMLTGLVSELRGFSAEEDKKGGFLGLFKKGQAKVNDLMTKYDKTEANVNKVVKAMEGHQVTLLKDVAMLDKMYETNLTYYKNLTLYIMAGKEKLAIAKQQELPKLLKKAEESGLPEDSQAASDYASMIERFEKKIYDLELTRNISMQMAPQIRLIQNNDTMMSEKIQSTLVNTIPLWKSQMVIAIGLNHSTQAAKAQREVTDMTNELLKKNAEALKIATVESAKEAERGIVDIETLTHTNQTLIDTLNEVVQIQADGRTKRAEAEKELSRIETEMHTKLIELSKATGGLYAQ
ncbi:MAG: toxic anion resistance protein [Lachnospiraceae bacterium]|nr:toxic anion resistance protein [Lachnospiraceae bacterium]